MSSSKWRSVVAAFALVAVTLIFVDNAAAQCATCPTPVVAYQPVVAQPTVAYRPYTGWYLGKYIDQWRMRRAATSAYRAGYAPTYTASYAPTYTAAYTPSYTASYTPTYTAAYTPTYTAAYRPYVTAYAPLATTVAAPCTTCTQTVARQVVMQPVVAAPACDTCSYTPSCECDACSGVTQAAYTEPACAGCAGGSSSNVLPPIDYGSGANIGTPNIGTQTPQPSLDPVPAPVRSNYGAEKQIDGGTTPTPAAAPPDDVDPLEDAFGPATDESDSSTYFNAPRLLDPRDRTARSTNSRRPTVGVWNAVYRKPVASQKASHTVRRTARPTQAEIDAVGWTAVAPSAR